MSTPLSVLALGSSVVEVRGAVLADVEEIVALLADDPLGSTRDGVTDDEDLAPYRRAFALIDADPAQLLVVVIADRAVVGTMQLTFIPGLARRGTSRAQVEAVLCGTPAPAHPRRSNVVARPSVNGDPTRRLSRGINYLVWLVGAVSLRVREGSTWV